MQVFVREFGWLEKGLTSRSASPSAGILIIGRTYTHNPIVALAHHGSMRHAKESDAVHVCEVLSMHDEPKKVKNSGRSSNVRMIDVAHEAGVARVTVSRVLSKLGAVSPEKRVAVLAAAKRMGYLRNFNASVLAGNRTLTVGAVVSELATPWISKTIGELSDALASIGFLLFIAQSGDEFDQESQLLESLFQRRIDALVLLDVQCPAGARSTRFSGRVSVVEVWDSLTDVDILAFVSQLARPNN